MADLLRAVQAALFTAATTIDLWRDVAIVILAGIVIGALFYVAETSAS